MVSWTSITLFATVYGRTGCIAVNRPGLTQSRLPETPLIQIGLLRTLPGNGSEEISPGAAHRGELRSRTASLAGMLAMAPLGARAADFVVW
jgi:hypothetical protein